MESNADVNKNYWYPAPSPIRVYCKSRRISFINRENEVIEVCFAGNRGKRGMKSFLLCCSVAIAQNISACNMQQSWNGASDEFLIAVCRHLNWEIKLNSLLAYWANFRDGKSATVHRVDIYAGGQVLHKKEQWRKAEDLFQQEGGLFLGMRRLLGNNIYEYWPIEFVGESDDVKSLRNYIEQYLIAVENRDSDDKTEGSQDTNIFKILSDAPPSLSGYLRIRDFKYIIDKRTPNFVGRRYIFDAIKNNIADQDFPSGYLVIKGEPGIGKTSLAAELVKRRDYLHYFNVAVQNIRSIRDFLANVCVQLIVRYKLAYRALPPEATQDSGFLQQLLAEVVVKIADGPVVIVVDALDEADDSSLPPNANRLCLPQNLPDGVFFVVTMREKYDDRLFVSRKRYIPLKDKDPRNTADVREYVYDFIAKNTVKMAERICQWNVTEKQFVEVVVKRSEGNFQYLDFVLPDIRKGKLSAGTIGNIDNLPIGLRDYYQRHWRMMKDRDPQRYSQLQRPILCMLATVQEPVTIDKLVELTQLQPSEILDVIKEWREFLNEQPSNSGKALYHLYHTSFAEFLEKEEGLAPFHLIIVETVRRKVKERQEEINRKKCKDG